jgi:hypothetical protein
MATPELPSDLPTATANAAALLLEGLWIQQERAALHRERLELALARDELARERFKLACERGDLARERAEFEREKARAQASAAAPPEIKLDVVDGRIVVPPRITYAWCCAFRTSPRHIRMQVSRVQRSQFLRVARMSYHPGRALDAAGIAFRWIRYAAYGEGLTAQEQRAEAILRGERPKPPPRPRRRRPQRKQADD